MRISVRRLRAALQSFPQVLPRSRTDHLMAELRWLGRELGDARDIEVLAERFRAALRKVPGELVLGPVEARVQAHFGPLRGEAQRRLLDGLDSARYLALLDELERLLDDPPVTAAGALPAGDELPPAVARAYRRVRRRMRRAREAPRGERRDTALHSARKAAKRARYAAEVLVPIRRKQAKRFARRMHSLQSVLGDFQDAVIARRAARDLGAKAFLAGENGFTFGLLYEREDATARRLRAKSRRVWKRASAAKHRRWLR
jgi:CHAD domain-containing protein